MWCDSWRTVTQETRSDPPGCIVCPQLPTCPRSCDLQSESPLGLPHTLIPGPVNQQPGRKCEERRAGRHNRLWIEAEDSGGRGVSDWRRPAPLGSVCLRSAADSQWQTWITQLPVSLMMLYANDFLLSSVSGWGGESRDCGKICSCNSLVNISNARRFVMHLNESPSVFYTNAHGYFSTFKLPSTI